VRPDRTRGHCGRTAGSRLSGSNRTHIRRGERTPFDRERDDHLRLSRERGGRLRSDEIDPAWIREAAPLHVTGILPALSATMAHTVEAAVTVAKDAGASVSFDLNFRSILWSPEGARSSCLKVIALVDLVFANDVEAELAVGPAPDPLETARRLCAHGTAQAVVKLGHGGAVANARGIEEVRAAVLTHVVDSVGAGGAFAGGYVADYVAGSDLADRFTTAVTMGSFACRSLSDLGVYPIATNSPQGRAIP